MCTSNAKKECDTGRLRVGVALLNVRSGCSNPSRRDDDTCRAGWETRGERRSERARREAPAVATLVGGPTPRPSLAPGGRRKGRLAGGSTPAQSTPRAVTLWAARSRGPVSDGREDGPEAAQQQTGCNSGTSPGRVVILALAPGAAVTAGLTAGLTPGRDQAGREPRAANSDPAGAGGVNV